MSSVCKYMNPLVSYFKHKTFPDDNIKCQLYVVLYNKSNLSSYVASRENGYRGNISPKLQQEASDF